MSVARKITIANGENFIHGTYNNINVIIREKDGFVNATAMCNQFNKRFRDIKEVKSWQTYYNEFMNVYYSSDDCPNTGDHENCVRQNTGGPIYLLKKGYLNDVRGTYVDPRLINYIAIWASPEYAVYVGKIMDSIDERGKAKLISDEENMNEVLNNLKREVEELKKQNEKLIEERKLNREVITDQAITNHKQNETIADQEEVIFDEAVRSGNINNRKLTIFEDDDKIKISADNKKKFNSFILQYTFPASMNIRMMIKDALRIKITDIKINDYNRLKQFLDDLNPKSRIEGVNYF